MARSIADARWASATDERPWGFWASLAWVGLALVLNDRFPRLEHVLLDGTQAGRIISHSFALGALNAALTSSVPLLVLMVAVAVRGIPLLAYFGWLAPSAGYAALALGLGLALQVVMYGVPYLLGADITSAAVAQYRHSVAAGQPAWLPFGFLWRGWEASRVGPRGTWLLVSLLFVAWHVPKALQMDPLNAGIMLVGVSVLGLVVGWLRWRSHITVPGMIAHAAFNIVPPAVTFTIGAALAG
jgi:hypothetical protein